MKYTYSVWIKTGKEHPLAGTDSNIAIQLIGTEGKTEIITIIPEDVYAYDIDSTDRVSIETDATLGEITRCCLGHDGSADTNWYVETVRIRDNVTRDEWFFTLNAWVRQVQADTVWTCAEQ